ncbi:MAG: hypothetical protein KJ709_02695 [Nanoarchaeota archaeon]|nr:hypothetical protein [Nanoarchaeota archaeon]
MKVIQVRATYKVESESRAGKYYSVTLEHLHCDCPHFMVRLKKTGGECKHIKAAREFIAAKRSPKNNKILDFIREQGEVDVITLIDRFDEATVNELIRKGDIMERNGKISSMD